MTSQVSKLASLRDILPRTSLQRRALDELLSYAEVDGSRDDFGFAFVGDGAREAALMGLGAYKRVVAVSDEDVKNIQKQILKNNMEHENIVEYFDIIFYSYIINSTQTVSDAVDMLLSAVSAQSGEKVGGPLNDIRSALSILLQISPDELADPHVIARAKRILASAFADELDGAVHTGGEKPILGKWTAATTDQPMKKIPLPESAPAIWKDDKQPGDTPPDFIKRHYADHLFGANETHEILTRPALNKLDPSCYTALANWLRSNNLPEDCQVPTKSEALTLTPPAMLDSTPEPTADMKAYWRAASKRHYGKQKNLN